MYSFCRRFNNLMWGTTGDLKREDKSPSVWTSELGMEKKASYTKGVLSDVLQFTEPLVPPKILVAMEKGVLQKRNNFLETGFQGEAGGSRVVEEVAELHLAVGKRVLYKRGG